MMVMPAQQQSQANQALRAATSRPTIEQQPLAVGAEVQVLADQSAVRMGPARWPGRRGTVIDRNQVAREDHGGLWYVKLAPTGRAQERVETFWGRELQVLPLAPAMDAAGPA